MDELKGIIGFEWDSGNSRKSTDKHGVSQQEAEQVFFNRPLLILEDVKHSQHELRLHAFGHTDRGCLLHITFTFRQDKAFIRVISARTMDKKEKETYGKAD